jgi:pyruvate ferredoxin oxidoreductase gamma subunit/2-oxoisovalerate ferredoxin oxidoreductase gamma subunit
MAEVAMKEIRLHGSGGHGAVVAAKLLADAAARSGYQSQAFASYGALRRGGKVEAYVRISDERVLVHCKMYEPDCLVIMEDQFVGDADVMSGLKEGGKILINSSKPASGFDGLDKFEVVTLDAYHIAREKGLSLPGGMPVINTAMLGGIAALLPEVRLDDLLEVIRTGTPKGRENMESAREAYDSVVGSQAGTGTATGTATAAAGAQSTEDRFPRYDPEKMSDKCRRCLMCYMACPVVAISFETEPFAFHVNTKACTGCGLCINECPRRAISWQGVNNG